MAATRPQTAYRAVSSPLEDDFHTGVSSVNPREAIHSTQQLGYTDREQWPSTWTRQMHRRQLDGADDSTDISIEQGRAVENTADLNDDVSSNVLFNFGDHSQYELAGTPPIRNRQLFGKVANVLSRQASQRKANESAKRSASQTARAVAEDVRRVQNARVEQENLTAETAQGILNPKNTRFTRAKQNMMPVTSPDTSVQIPEVTGIEQLIRDAARDMLPPVTRNTANTRFVPASRRQTLMPLATNIDRLPLQNVPIPEDEKKIYQSLQLLHGKIESLEAERAAAIEQLAVSERENSRLREVAHSSTAYRQTNTVRMPSSGTQSRVRVDRLKLEESVHLLQQRLEQAENKLLQSETARKQVTKERDDLVTQIGLDCYRLEEVEAENDTLREQYSKLLTQNDQLRKDKTTLQEEINNARSSRARSGDVRAESTNAFMSSMPATNGLASQAKKNKQPISMINLDTNARTAIAEAVRAHLCQSQKDETTGQVTVDVRTAEIIARLARQRLHNHLGDEIHDPTMTEFEVTNTGRVPTNTFNPHNTQHYRATHQRHASAPVNVVTSVEEAEQLTQGLTRKSAIKDTFDLAQTTDGAARAARTVRVKSPSADLDDEEAVTGELPATNLAGRRRRRSSATREEGETSEFIIPDITIRSSKNQPHALNHTASFEHTKNCTVCAEKTGQQVDIPQLISISAQTDSSGDMTERPTEPAELAMARVKKQLDDELIHHKISLKKLESEYHGHDPSIGARRRLDLHKQIVRLRRECERKASMIYSMQDIYEAQSKGFAVAPQAPVAAAAKVEKVTVEDDDESDDSNSSRYRPAELAGRISRSIEKEGLDGAANYPDDISIGLPDWDGGSDAGF